MLNVYSKLKIYTKLYRQHKDFVHSIEYQQFYNFDNFYTYYNGQWRLSIYEQLILS